MWREMVSIKATRWNFANRGNMADYEVGYGKPPKHTQFGKPDGPPTGKTSEHRRAEIKAAELAAMVQADLVEALYNTLQQAEGDEAKLGAIKADVLKLLKDSQDRGFGSPQQHIDNTSSDGSIAMPTQIVVKSAHKNSPESDGEAT